MSTADLDIRDRHRGRETVVNICDAVRLQLEADARQLPAKILWEILDRGEREEPLARLAWGIAYDELIRRGVIDL